MTKGTPIHSDTYGNGTVDLVMEEHVVVQFDYARVLLKPSEVSVEPPCDVESALIGGKS